MTLQMLHLIENLQTECSITEESKEFTLSNDFVFTKFAKKRSATFSLICKFLFSSFYLSSRQFEESSSQFEEYGQELEHQDDLI
jgi:hypothetical protein